MSENYNLLQELSETLDLVSDENEYALNIETNEIICTNYDYLSEDEILELEQNWQKYRSLPTKWDINEYAIMEGFAQGFPDQHMREKMLTALIGRGAFRRFKDCIFHLGISEEWFSYKDKAFYEIAKKWYDDIKNA